MKSAEIIPIPDELIVRRIHVMRGKKVMLDRDLAALYGVETRVLTQAVRRNKDRFPEEFMFQLTWEEAEASRSQNVILNDAQETASRSQNGIAKRGGNIKYRPYAFTEPGVAMLSSVLRSKRAIQINILIIKAFIRMRELLETNQVLREKLAAMERQLGTHSKEIKAIYSLLQRLLVEPEKPTRPIGFHRPSGTDKPQ
jgi:phage regulator Rha-like protein